MRSISIRHSCQCGFTLIELMLVVGIIVILSALAIPLFSEYRKNAGDATAHADAKNAISILVAAQQ